MRVKKLAVFMFQLFCVVTTLQVALLGLMGLFNIHTVENLAGGRMCLDNMLNLLLISLCSTLPVPILLWSETISRAEKIFRRVIHFAITVGAVFGLLYAFGWISIINLWILIGSFFLVYFPAYAIKEGRERAAAVELDRQIQKVRAQESNEIDKD